MKLRIIKTGVLFVPQQCKKDYYSRNRWVGFGCPNIKFSDENHACLFVNLIDKHSVPSVAKGENVNIIWKNYK